MQKDNTVELLEFGGGDKSHALTAWASTFFELELDMPEDIHIRVDKIVEYILANSKRIRNVEQLLQYLAAEGHTSPFRASFLMYGITNDIATHIHLLTHKVAIPVNNGESARYKVIKDNKYYIPYDWENTPMGKLWADKLRIISEQNNQLYLQCYDDLVADGMSKARAKETARYFKMYNSQMNTVKCLNFDGLMQVYAKRNLKTASQREVARVVEDMVQCVREIPGNPFEYSLKAFNL